MPRTPVDYSKIVIYKIQHIEDESLIYVGSTTDFTRRKAQHKSVCYNRNNTGFNYKKYQMIRENGGWDMFQMIEIEKYPCTDKRQAEKREDEIMRELKTNMNSHKAYLEIEEKRKYQKEYHIQYYNKEKITCECGCVIVKKCLIPHMKTKKHINLMTNK
mmetsp:Transcript_23477/g.27576  ORF Transcript_23477/g.27576 Transcript_23477/m.27576 type:complete len:159 (+) Transcript_23477:90-566(+)